MMSCTMTCGFLRVSARERRFSDSTLKSSSQQALSIGPGRERFELDRSLKWLRATFFHFYPPTANKPITTTVLCIVK